MKKEKNGIHIPINKQKGDISFTCQVSNYFVSFLFFSFLFWYCVTFLLFLFKNLHFSKSTGECSKTGREKRCKNIFFSSIFAYLQFKSSTKLLTMYIRILQILVAQCCDMIKKKLLHKFRNEVDLYSASCTLI